VCEVHPLRSIGSGYYRFYLPGNLYRYPSYRQERKIGRGDDRIWYRYNTNWLEKKDLRRKGKNRLVFKTEMRDEDEKG
jgi:hypothetical protein